MLIIKMLRYLKLSPVLVVFLYPAFVFAEVSIIVHPSNNSIFTEKDIKKIFLAKKNNFHGGRKVEPVNLQKGNPTRDEFNEKLLGRDEGQIRAYWARVVFSGAALPPKVLESSNEILEQVAKNPNAIGYVNSSEVNDSVKIVYKK